MTEEDSGSVLGGIEEVAGSAWNAAGHLAEAEVETAAGIGNFWAGAADNVVSGVAHMTGATETQAEYDQATDDRARAYEDSMSNAGEAVEKAWTDIVGE
jgi:hypothetical protein